MSTDTTEAAIDPAQDLTADKLVRCNSCDYTRLKSRPGPCPNGHTSGFRFLRFAEPDDHGANVDAALEHAGPEGATVDTPDGPVAFTPAEDEPSPEHPDAVAKEMAEAHLYDIQDRLDRAKHRMASSKEQLKFDKEDVEELQDQLDQAVRKLRHARADADPGAYPLFDQAKAIVNGMFPKPEAIPPLPPDTFEEALGRKQRDTTVLAMGLKAGTHKALEDLGLKTAADVVRKWNEVLRDGKPFDVMKGITDLRAEEIADALNQLTEECQAEWDATHPGTPGAPSQ